MKFLLILLLCPFVMGQELIDTIIVQASRFDKTVRANSRDIQVITAAQIQQQNLTTSEDILRIISGVEVRQRGTGGIQQDISVRGSSFSQVVILIDGIRWNDPLTGHFNSNLPIHPSNIERIEIVKTAESLQYGADAIGGIINIITKQSQESQAVVELNYGSHNTWSGTANAQISKNKFTTKLQGTIAESDGEELPGGTDSYFQKNQIQAEIVYRFSDDFSMGIQSLYDKREFNAQYFYTTSSFDFSEEETTAWRNTLFANYKLNGHHLNLRITNQTGSDYFLFNPAFPANDHETNRFQPELHYTKWLNNKIKIGAGYQGTFNTVESTDRGNHEETYNSFYAFALIQPLDHYHVDAGIRFEIDDNGETIPIPHIGISHKLLQGVLFLNTGKSYRNPDITERFTSTGLSTVSSGRNLGNPLLKAEEAWSYELGYRQSNTTSNFSLAGFYRNVESIIDYEITDTETVLATGYDYEVSLPDTVLWAVNLDHIEFYGLDLSYNRRLVDNDDLKLDFDLNYVFTESVRKIERDVKYQSNFAKHLIKPRLSVRYKSLGFTTGLVYKYRDIEEEDFLGITFHQQYSIVNAGLFYQFQGINSRVYCNASNVFDAEEFDILGAKLPGAWLTIGYRQNINFN